MNQLELEYARKRKNKTKAEMAAAIGKSVVSYCEKHKDYKNNRAVHAIANICRVYDKRLENHDFLRSSSEEREDAEY